MGFLSEFEELMQRLDGAIGACDNCVHAVYPGRPEPVHEAAGLIADMQAHLLECAAELSDAYGHVVATVERTAEMFRGDYARPEPAKCWHCRQDEDSCLCDDFGPHLTLEELMDAGELAGLHLPGPEFSAVPF